MIFGKEAMLLLYFDIFSVKKAFKHAIVAMIVYTALSFGSNLIIAPIYCAPHIGESWDPHEGYSRIFERCSVATWYAAYIGVSDALVETIIFVIPIPIVLQLQLHRKQKIQILAVSTTALMLVICGNLNKGDS